MKITGNCTILQETSGINHPHLAKPLGLQHSCPLFEGGCSHPFHKEFGPWFLSLETTYLRAGFQLFSFFLCLKMTTEFSNPNAGTSGSPTVVLRHFNESNEATCPWSPTRPTPMAGKPVARWSATRHVLSCRSKKAPQRDTMPRGGVTGGAISSFYLPWYKQKERMNDR